MGHRLDLGDATGGVLQPGDRLILLLQFVELGIVSIKLLRLGIAPLLQERGDECAQSCLTLGK